MAIESVKSNLLTFFKKNIRIIVFAFIILLLLTVPVLAWPGKQMFRDLCNNWVDTIFSGGLTDSVTDIILTNPATKFPSAWSVMVNVYNNTILPIAFALLSLYLVINIVQQSIKLDQLTVQQFIKPLLLYLAAFIVMKYGMSILLKLINVGQYIVESMSFTSSDAMDRMLATAHERVNDAVTGIPSGIAMTVELFLPYAAALILSLAIKIVCYTRIFELYLKTMFAPLGMGDLITKGLDSNGLRFFKNYFATCLQGAVIVGISVIYSSIIGSLISANTETSIVGMAGTALVMGFAALSMMMKAGSLAKEVLGS
jgi:hypothetical protein